MAGTDRKDKRGRVVVHGLLEVLVVWLIGSAITLGGAIGSTPYFCFVLSFFSLHHLTSGMIEKVGRGRKCRSAQEGLGELGMEMTFCALLGNPIRQGSDWLGGLMIRSVDMYRLLCAGKMDASIIV